MTEPTLSQPITFIIEELAVDLTQVPDFHSAFVISGLPGVLLVLLAIGYCVGECYANSLFSAPNDVAMLTLLVGNDVQRDFVRYAERTCDVERRSVW